MRVQCKQTCVSVCVTQEILSAAQEFVLFLVMIHHLYTHFPKLSKSSIGWDIQVEITIYRCPYVSQGCHYKGKPGNTVSEAEGLIQLTDRAAGWDSVQFSTQKILQCVGKTAEYMRHPCRTNRHDIRYNVCPSGMVQGPGRVSLLAPEATGSISITPHLLYFSS